MNDASGQASDYLLIAKRNNSLSLPGRRLFFASMVIVSFAIAIVWAMQGAWYVLPFAGVEMAALFLALMIIGRHAEDYETIVVSGDRIRVERREGGRISRDEFNRYWAQLVTREGPGDRCELALRSHGREVPLGRYLTDEQKRTVACELRSKLKHIR